MPFCSKCGSREYYCSRCGELKHCDCNSSLYRFSVHDCLMSTALENFSDGRYCSQCGQRYPSKQYCTRCGTNITPIHICRKSGDLSYLDILDSPKQHICSDSLI